MLARQFLISAYGSDCGASTEGNAVSTLLKRLSVRASYLSLMLASTLYASQCAAGPVEIVASGCSVNQKYFILDNSDLSISVTMNRNEVCKVEFAVPYHYVRFVINNKAKNGFVGLAQSMPFGLMMTSVTVANGASNCDSFIVRRAILQAVTASR
jgi:hypothetical protein